MCPAVILAAAVPVNAERQLLALLIQLGIIIGAARLFSFLFRRIGQPGVVGEICAGLVLGPSVLGRLEQLHWIPPISAAIFHPEGVPPVLPILSQLGLVLVMFLVGLEFDYSHLRRRTRSATAISLVGVVVPFGLGATLGMWMLGHLPAFEAAPTPLPRTGFILFMGTAMAITALPVLGRMMIEMRITRTRLAAITITAAAMEDACGWMLLAAVSSVSRGEPRLGDTLCMLVLTLGFCFVVLVIVRPLVGRWAARVLPAGTPQFSHGALALILLAVVGCAIATSLIGIFGIFGAFLFGAAISAIPGVAQAIHRAMGDFVTIFLLPLFFTNTGLRTDISLLNGPGLWLLTAAVLAVAVLGKVGGCGLAALLSGFKRREAACIGILMNTRGLMELAVINVGYELGAIPRSVFCMLVLMAVATTLMTTPALALAMRGTELEEHLVAAGFARLRTARGFDIAGSSGPAGV
jgi:Kef-type K+ transport system membrane component KefB